MDKLPTVLDSIDDLSEDIAKFYTKTDDGFVLQLTGEINGVELENMPGLLSSQEQLKGDLVKAKKDLKDLKAKMTADERKRAEDSGDLAAVVEQMKSELETLSDENKNLKTSLQGGDVDKALDSLVSTLTKDTDRAKALKKLAAPMAKHNGEKVVFEISGTEQDASIVASLLKKDYPFLVDGTQSRGGASEGGESGGAAKQMQRSEFEKLDPEQQYKFAMDGGELFD